MQTSERPGAQCNFTEEASMDSSRRKQIQRSLCTVAESYAAMMEFLQQAFGLLCEESSLDPFTYLHTRPLPTTTQGRGHSFRIEPNLLSVTFRGKTCFLGNTYAYKLLCRLARRPNTYVSYEELLADVWQGVRSNSAVRSAVKTLRSKLRRRGLTALAQAIDGVVPRHYRLKLDN
jgi:hypothetical protein